MNRIRRALLLVAVTAALGAASAQAQITRMVVFGDSLSDTGNYFAYQHQPAPPYEGGRASNGPVFVEYLADLLRVSRPTPSFPSAGQAAGTNFAYFGAKTGSDYSGGVPNLLLQVDLSKGRVTLGPTDLVTVWIGGNNLLDGGDPGVAANDVETAIRTLAASGGRQFLVPKLPPVGVVPEFKDDPLLGITMSNLAFTYNSLVDARIQAIQASVPGLTFYRPDFYGLFLAMVANPAAYGFTNVRDALLTSGNYYQSGYMFWDTQHPTTETHRMLAQATVQ